MLNTWFGKTKIYKKAVDNHTKWQNSMRLFLSALGEGPSDGHFNFYIDKKVYSDICDPYINYSVGCFLKNDTRQGYYSITKEVINHYNQLSKISFDDLRIDQQLINLNEIKGSL